MNVVSVETFFLWFIQNVLHFLDYFDAFAIREAGQNRVELQHACIWKNMHTHFGLQAFGLKLFEMD